MFGDRAVGRIGFRNLQTGNSETTDFKIHAFGLKMDMHTVRDSGTYLAFPFQAFLK